MRLDSTSASERVGRWTSGNASVAAKVPPRTVSTVCGMLSVSSTAQFLEASRKPLSEALESRRSGNCRGTVFDAGGGIDTLERSAVPWPVTGSDDRAFLLLVDGVPSPEASRCGVQKCVLSELAVRESSMGLTSALTLGGTGGVLKDAFSFSRTSDKLPCGIRHDVVRNLA
jgi:hypothetical protein